jgi:hypothetical protein
MGSSLSNPNQVILNAKNNLTRISKNTKPKKTWAWARVLATIIKLLLSLRVARQGPQKIENEKEPKFGLMSFLDLSPSSNSYNHL